jgi:hypothetical protein
MLLEISYFQHHRLYARQFRRPQPFCPTFLSLTHYFAFPNPRFLVFLFLACGTVKRLKAKLSDNARLRGFVQEFGETYFSTYGKILFWKVSETSVMAAKCFCVQQHCETTKQRKQLHLQSTKHNRQKLLFENPETSPSKNITVSQGSM